MPCSSSTKTSFVHRRPLSKAHTVAAGSSVSHQLTVSNPDDKRNWLYSGAKKLYSMVHEKSYMRHIIPSQLHGSTTDNTINLDLLYMVLYLDRRLVSYRYHSLDSSLCINCSFLPRPQRLPLQEHVHTLRLSLLLLACVVFDPVDKLLP